MTDDQDENRILEFRFVESTRDQNTWKLDAPDDRLRYIQWWLRDPMYDDVIYLTLDRRHISSRFSTDLDIMMTQYEKSKIWQDYRIVWRVFRLFVSVTTKNMSESRISQLALHNELKRSLWLSFAFDFQTVFFIVLVDLRGSGKRTGPSDTGEKQEIASFNSNLTSTYTLSKKSIIRQDTHIKFWNVYDETWRIKHVDVVKKSTWELRSETDQKIN